jgi:hypothetical protein
MQIQAPPRPSEGVKALIRWALDGVTAIVKQFRENLIRILFPIDAECHFVKGSLTERLLCRAVRKALTNQPTPDVILI